MIFARARDFFRNYLHPYNYRAKEEYYQDRLFPQMPSVLLSLFKDSENIIPTDIEIKYEENNWLIPEVALCRNFGEPVYILNLDFFPYTYNILFSKYAINGSKILRQTHFIDNQFFYACDTFKNLDVPNKYKLKKNFLEKYQCSKGHPGDNRLVLKDELNNGLSIMEDVYMRVCYLSGDRQISKILTEQRSL